eukprot:scaffold3411_cov396-Prasinococcus_capsulatus_cf.AAC.3
MQDQAAFFQQWDPPPPPAPEPLDQELKKRIDKLVEYGAKNGPQFVNMILEKQQRNPQYAFLQGGDGAAYFRFALYYAVKQLPLPPPLPPAGVPYLGPAAQHPQAAATQAPAHALQPSQQPASFQAQPPQGPPLPSLERSVPAEVASACGNVLSNLTGSKESIKNARAWAVSNQEHARFIVAEIVKRTRELSQTQDLAGGHTAGETDAKLYVLYLVNDIVFAMLKTRKEPEELDAFAVAIKPYMNEILQHNLRGPGQSQKEKLGKVLQYWRNREVFDGRFIDTLERDLQAPPLPHLQPQPLAQRGHPIPHPQGQQTNHGPSASVVQAQSFDHPLPQLTDPYAQKPTMQQPNQPQRPSSVPPPSTTPYNKYGTAVTPSNRHVPSTLAEEKEFAVGLIPFVVEKQRSIGSPLYSSLNPMFIPVNPPHSSVEVGYLNMRLEKFYSQIGLKVQTELPVGKSDPGTNMLADGSLAPEIKRRNREMDNSGFLGLGAATDPSPADEDEFSAFRKGRASAYHNQFAMKAKDAVE